MFYLKATLEPTRLWLQLGETDEPQM